MRPTSGVSRASAEPAALRRRGVGARGLLLACLVDATAPGCASHDAVVGRAPAVDGAVPTWSTDFAAADDAWEVQTVLDGASVAFGARNADATDGFVAELRFPGHAGVAGTVDVGPNLATQIATKRTFRYGTFRARLQFATCAPGEEIASAFFLFFYVDADTNGNGLPDNPELDLQVLCDAPSFVVLTAWSDYAEATPATPEQFLKVSRAVDLATGDIYDAPSETTRAFAKTGNAPELARGSFVPGGFYDVGIDWRSDEVRFFILLDGAELTLLDVTDPRFIPNVSMQLMLNLWHPQVHWVPRTGEAAYPANDGILRVDRVSYDGP
jgi:hypothetical protein